jgi:hypothetical protein
VTTLAEQIEQMRIRMNQLAAEEYGLVRTLGDALASADRRLLEEVRGVAAAHEARRGAISRELQALAARMCALHRPQEPRAPLEGPLQAEAARETKRVAHDDGRAQAPATLQDEIAFHLRIRADGQIGG